MLERLAERTSATQATDGLRVYRTDSNPARPSDSYPALCTWDVRVCTTRAWITVMSTASCGVLPCIAEKPVFASVATWVVHSQPEIMIDHSFASPMRISSQTQPSCE